MCTRCGFLAAVEPVGPSLQNDIVLYRLLLGCAGVECGFASGSIRYTAATFHAPPQRSGHLVCRRQSHSLWPSYSRENGTVNEPILGLRVSSRRHRVTSTDL